MGNDGNWSSFAVQAGTPLHTFEVLISTAGTSTWLIDPVGCDPGPKVAEDCFQARGGVFNSNDSKTWVDEGFFGTDLELNLGSRFEANASYGLETLMLGNGNLTGKNNTLQSQVVATIGTNAFYNGLFGLNNQPTNFTFLNETHPSFLSTLKSRNLIPSLSWGYTAGASYRRFSHRNFLRAINRVCATA